MSSLKRTELPQGWRKVAAGVYESDRYVLRLKNMFGEPWQLEKKDGTPVSSYSSLRAAWQLIADREIADALTNVRKCRVCGCSEDDPCVDPNFGDTCSWTRDKTPLCSVCGAYAWMMVAAIGRGIALDDLVGRIRTEINRRFRNSGGKTGRAIQKRRRAL